jgi:hypothetical protein
MILLSLYCMGSLVERKQCYRDLNIGAWNIRSLYMTCAL